MRPTAIDPLNPKPPPGGERAYWERFARSGAYRMLMRSEMMYFKRFWISGKGGKTMRLWTALLLLAPAALLALAGGCASAKDAVTDGDRAVIHQTEQAAARIAANTKETETKAIAEVAQANMKQLEANFGPPKDPGVLQPYSPEQSEKDRKQSEKEHKDKAGFQYWWQVAGATVFAAGGWLLRTYGLGSIPIVGPALASLSARLGNGAATNEKIAAGAMTALDKVRDRLDRQQPITGPDVVAMVRSAMSDAGVLPQNTLLYKATDTGVPETASPTQA